MAEQPVLYQEWLIQNNSHPTILLFCHFLQESAAILSSCKTFPWTQGSQSIKRKTPPQAAIKWRPAGRPPSQRQRYYITPGRTPRTCPGDKAGPGQNPGSPGTLDPEAASTLARVSGRQPSCVREYGRPHKCHYLPAASSIHAAASLYPSPVFPLTLNTGAFLFRWRRPFMKKSSSKSR